MTFNWCGKKCQTAGWEHDVFPALLNICIEAIDVGYRCCALSVLLGFRFHLHTRENNSYSNRLKRHVDICICHMLEERSCLVMCVCVWGEKPSVCLQGSLSRHSNRVLRLSDEMSMTTLHWDLALCLLLAWVMCYFCIWKGIKSTGKARTPEHVCGGRKWSTRRFIFQANMPENSPLVQKNVFSPSPACCLTAVAYKAKCP